MLSLLEKSNERGQSNDIKTTSTEILGEIGELKSNVGANEVSV